MLIFSANRLILPKSATMTISNLSTLSISSVLGLVSRASGFLLTPRPFGSVSGDTTTSALRLVTASVPRRNFTSGMSRTASSNYVHTGSWHSDQHTRVTGTCSQRSFTTGGLGHCLSGLHCRGSNAVKCGPAASGGRLFSSGASGETMGEVTFVENEDAKQRKSDPGMVAFVTGANRGIGLEVTRQLLERTAGTVIAACRDPSSAADLHQLGDLSGNHNRLDIVKLDVTSQASVESVAEHAKNTHGRVDLLFNVAGILGDGKTTPGPERSLRAMDREWLRQTLEVNTVGPMMLVSALSPLLESSTKRKGKTSEGTQAVRAPSVVVNFSARVGSIGDNGLGGWHSYRMSKAALNMATKGISIELRRRRVWSFSYHPGTTDTGLSKPFQANVKPEKLFTTAYTVSQMLGIVDCMNEQLSGGFFAFDGSRIEW